jgi:hypothetical protein
MAKARFGVIVCHRRFGKTVCSVNHLQRSAMTCGKERPRLGYLAPTYTQGKAIAWDYVKHYAQPVQGHDTNESELRVEFPQNQSQVRIFGADNPDSLRGMYFDGVALDEFGLMPPKTFSEVIRPTLSDRRGWALFMGTPNGKNQFYEIAQQAQREVAAGNPDWFYAVFKASETGILSPEELTSARETMTADEYAQEYECSFEASVKGAIFAREVQQAREQGRVTHVPYDPALPVDTDWDLGVGDATAIWFSQTSPSGQVRLIDYAEASGKGLPYFKQLLTDKTHDLGYAYGTHWAPHDIQVRELGSGRSRLETAYSLGITFQITPKVERVEDRIHAARMLLPRCWFDRERCEVGLEALQHYHWKPVASQHPTGRPLPVHDWASHGADAFGGLAFRHYTPRFNPEKQAAAALRKAQKDSDPYDRTVQRQSVRGGY